MPRRVPTVPEPLPVPEAEEPTSEALVPWFYAREELRLDVDGRYPMMVASGTLFLFLRMRIHWIANLSRTGPYAWAGDIWYKDGNTASFPYTRVRIDVTPSFLPGLRKARVIFSGGGATPRAKVYRFRSPYYHTVALEFDCAEGTTPVTTVNTCAHPNRPASLPCENLSIETVFRRAGFDVSRSGDTVVPISGAGVNAKWSDMEMHDAMQVYWSRFANKAQWAMWVFFASLHEAGTSLGGIMFDDIGPNHRQGTAIFNDSFIKNAPAGETHPDEWVRRMRFWTACHEMGHSFNLAHSWQKALGTPWIPLANEPEARSFMNYPYFVSGGQTAFFSDFEYRFSDGELLFVRHAPHRFVQPGNADWFDHHGFEQAEVSMEPKLRLECRVNREKAEFEFLEPVMAELKLTNVSDGPQIIDENMLRSGGEMTVVVKKEGSAAREYRPYATYCVKSVNSALMPGESKYEPLYISSGLNGWDVSEPGRYIVQVCLHLADEDVVSNALRFRVAPPRGYDEEHIAQDFFTDEVGRAIQFDGTRFFEEANDTLREVADRLSDRAVAIHAKVALATPLAHEYKVLQIDSDVPQTKSAAQVGAKIVLKRPKVDAATKELKDALTKDPDRAAQTLGHVEYHQYVDDFSEVLAKAGAKAEAAKAQDVLYKTLSERNVLKGVLADIKSKREKYK